MRDVGVLLFLATGGALTALFSGGAVHSAVAFILVWLLLVVCGSMLAEFAWRAVQSERRLHAFAIIIGWAGLYGVGGAWSGPVLQALVGLERIAGWMRSVSGFDIPLVVGPIGDLEMLLFWSLGGTLGFIIFLSHATHTLVLGPATRDQT